MEDLLNLKITVASKSEELAAGAPSSVTVFTRAEIRRLGVTSLEDLLDYVPGFQSLRDVEQGLSTRIAARGRSSALSESVLVLVDGQRLNDLYSGGVSILNRAIAVENIARVEIIRGPGSALYGANAFLGVIDIHTIDSGQSVASTFGEHGTTGLAVALSATPADDVRVSGFARFYDDDGGAFPGVTDAFGRTGTQRDPLSGIDANLRLSYKGLTLSARHTERRLGGFLIFGSLQDAAGRESTAQSSVALQYDRQLGESVGVSARLSYGRDAWDTRALIVPAGVELAPGFAPQEEFRTGPSLEGSALALAVDVRWRLHDSNQILAGAVVERDQLLSDDTQSNFDPRTLEYAGQFVRFTDEAKGFNSTAPRSFGGIYVQDQQEIGESLKLTVGARADFYDDFGSSLNPRAAVVYKTPVSSWVKVMYGRALRAPNYLELHDRNNPVDFGNPGLHAETVDSFEVAYVQRVGDGFEGSATYFFNAIHDIVEFTDSRPDDPENPLLARTFGNSGKLDTQGVELELRAHPLADLDLYGSFTFIQAGDDPTTGKEAELAAPKVFGSLAVNYRIGAFNVNASTVVRGKTDLLADQGAYALVNGRLEYVVFSGVAVYLSGHNLLDQRYVTYSKALPGGVPNRGRWLAGGVNVQL